MSDLSIIIVNYNTKELTLGCIKSIQESNINFPFEIIIVDNGSNDGSITAISSLKSSASSIRLAAKRTGGQVSNLKLIENKENVGFAKAVNQGIRISKGKYILLLNSDTRVSRNAISDLIVFVDKTPDAAITGTALVSPNGNIQESVYHFPTILGAIKEYWFGKKEEYNPYIPKGKRAVEVDSVFGTVFLIRKKVVEEIGEFDERFFMYYEDIEYCRRARKSGFKVYYLPSVRVLHYLGASGKNLAKWDLQWRRLIPSSKIYHGVITHYLIFFIIKTSQVISKMLKNIHD